jgi:two-component system, OmpR family, KDP operon response regulator KdpE
MTRAISKERAISVHTVLIVEDEPRMRNILRVLLTGEGYAVLEASSGAEAIRLAFETDPALILLDLGLPDMDGVDVAMRIREASRVPIVALTVRSDERDVVQALDHGANDFLTKPFRERELFARIRVSLRDREERPTPSWTAGRIELHPHERRASLDGRQVKLSGTEYRLLAVLMKSRGAVVTHEHLLRSVWGDSRSGEVGYLRVYMHHLREKLELDPSAPRWLLTEPGIGYRLVDDP